MTGSGSFSLYYLFAEDIAKAVIAGAVAFGASLMTNFWEGFGGILKPGAKKVGEEAADQGPGEKTNRDCQKQF